MALQLPPTPDFNVKIPSMPDPLQKAMQMAQLKDMLGANSLRQSLAPLQVQEAQGRVQQQQTANEMSDLKLNSLRAKVKAWSDPDFAANITGSNKSSASTFGFDPGFDPHAMIKGLVSRGVLPDDAMADAASFLELSKNLSLKTKDDLFNYKEAHEQLANLLAPIEDMKGSEAATALLRAKQKAHSIPGLDPQDVQFLQQADLEHLPALAAHLGIAGKIADFHKGQAEASKQTADAALANIKLNLSANSKPGDFDQQIDQIMPPKGPNATLNQQTKVLANAALGKGDYETAQKAVEHAASTLQEMSKTEYVQNREDYRAALARQANQSNQLQKNGLEQLDKIWTDPQHGYTQFLAQANATKNAIASAKDGNELAASLAPLMTVLGVNSFAGVHRINPQEYAAAGPEVGSIYRRINTSLDKAVSGKLNPDTAGEMNKLVDDLMTAKHSSLVPASQLIAKNAGLDPTKTTVFGKDGKPDTLESVSKPSAALTPLKAPTGATMKVPGSDGKLHWSDGKKDLGVAE